MNDIDNIMTMFQSIGNKLSYEKICQLSSEQKKEYERLLNDLKLSNSSNLSSNEKGKILEEISSFVLKTVGIFDVYNNIRTSTNELDQLVKTNNMGKILCSYGIVDKRLNNFICECKNYQDKLSVTYVGKVCSLLSTTQNKICILFSYHGVTGKDWEDSMGLIKKFYLSKEELEKRMCIIDFNIDDFESIKNGSNLLKIIEDKILSLQIDTSYMSFMSEHEATSKVLQLQEL